MKKTHKIVMGITALVVAFSACAFTACNSEPEDGSIKGNYKEASSEQINTVLSTVDEEKLVGDTSAEDYKFGIDFSSELNFSFTNEIQSISYSLSANYKMLTTAGEDAFSYKGAGDFILNGTQVKDDQTETAEATINLWQDDYITYAKATSKMSSSEDEYSYNIKFDMSSILAELLPDIGGDSLIPELPAEIELPEGITLPEVSSMNLVTIVNKLNEMGATVAMDITSGIKLKISFNEELVLKALALATNMSEETLSSQITFDKCGLDFYLAIDRNGMLSATSIVTDIEISQPQTTESTEVTPNIKLNGFIRLAVNSNIAPEVPETLATDASYMDMTYLVSSMLGNVIGNIGITG